MGITETASPIVTTIAAHFGPSSAMAQSEPKRVAPSTRARPRRKRESGRCSLARRVSSDSKKRICHNSAPATASSIAITDWKYRTGTSMPCEYRRADRLALVAAVAAVERMLGRLPTER
jgi:hypothetical protein